MRGLRGLGGIVVAIALWGASGDASAAVWFEDDFNGHADDDAVVAAGWAIVDVNEPIEQSTWTITNPGARHNPPTADGTPSDGYFMISDSDAQYYSNLVDSGMSHDLHTPSFGTLGAGAVWLHADVCAQLNNDGAAVFDIDVSTDGGQTWTNAFRRVAPGRFTWNGATTVLPDNTNADGYYGRLDVDLTGLAANHEDVRLRVRHFEPNQDWWIAIDNVLIDDVAPPRPGWVEVFAEDFGDGTLGGMTVDGLLGERTWTTTDPGGKYNPGLVDTNYVNRIGHPEVAANFAMIDNDGRDFAVDDYLMTPVLDLSALSEVLLGYESEGSVPVNDEGDAMRVLLMRDDDANGPDADDEILKVVFDYSAALFEYDEEPFYARRLLEVPEAAGRDDVFFAWHFAGADDWYWAVDNVAVTGKTPTPPAPGDANNDGGVDAADAAIVAQFWLKTGGARWGEGDFNDDGNVDDLDLAILAANWGAGAGGTAVPEPSTLVLAAVAAALAFRIARRRCPLR